MKYPTRPLVYLLPAISVLACPAPPATGQGDGPAVRRLRGIIDEDQTWSGRILITDDLTIQDATVTIAAGATIEFANKRPGHHPILSVGTVDGGSGHLRLLGNAGQPITFRTREGTNPGRLMVFVRSRIIPARTTGDDPGKSTPAQMVPSDVTWQHIRFEDLGHVFKKRYQGKAGININREFHVAEAAVTFDIVGAAHTLGVVNCTFENTARLLVRAADGARVTLAGCRFERPKERVGLAVFGLGGAAPVGAIAITRNTLAAAVSLHSAPAAITDNVLIGVDAAMVLEEDTSSETRIAGNYVHNTTKDDDGRYCLRCENPAALIENNIFRGGSTCVWSGSRRMSGNVLIGAPRLAAQYVKSARTHQLVHALPPGAIFERNLLLGPAYSLLVPQPPPQARRVKQQDAAAPTIIRNNLFDGFSRTNRAIHLNLLGRTPVPVAVLNNVFVRVGSLVYDEGKSGTTLTYADHNAVAPPAARAFDQVEIEGIKRGDPGWGANDVECEDVVSMYLAAGLLDRVPDYDTDILARRISTDQLRRRLFDAYRPQPHSPLVHAGRPRSAGAADAAPSIGPSEPGHDRGTAARDP